MLSINKSELWFTTYCIVCGGEICVSFNDDGDLEGSIELVNPSPSSLFGLGAPLNFINDEYGGYKHRNCRLK